MLRRLLDPLPRLSTTAAVRVAFAAAAVLALAVITLRSEGGRGVEVQRRDPPAGLDEIRVDVGGAVVAPGVYVIEPGMRVVDAIELAGGLAEGAETAPLNLSRRLRDEDRVRVPRVGELPALLDVNAASASELDALPGIGEAYSAAIVEARDLEGPFVTTDALVERGVLPEHVYEQIRDLIAAR